MPPLSNPINPWIDALNNDLLSAEEQPDTHVIRCATIGNTTKLMHGKKLSTAHPNALIWLDRFTQQNGMSLCARQHRTHAPTELRKRRNSESQLALGIDLLIQKAVPHLSVNLPQIGYSARSSFRSTHPRLPASSLVALSHTVKTSGKHFVIEGNNFLQRGDEQKQQIDLYAGTVTTRQARKTFCYFESDAIHALAYPFGRDYVFDLIIGGGFGLASKTNLPLGHLDKERLHLSFFTQPGGECCSGLLRACYSMAMSDSTDAPTEHSASSTETSNNPSLQKLKHKQTA